MAPRIEAVYAHIEELLGKEFSEVFYRALDDLIVKLRAQPPSARTGPSAGSQVDNLHGAR
jgi:hypothetical protein